MVGILTSAAKAVHPNPTLHVECCTHHPASSPRTLADQVEKWLRKRYARVKLKQTFPALDGFHSARDIDFITVADLTPDTDSELTSDIHLSDVDINVVIFELHGDEEQIDPSEATRMRIAQDAHDGVPGLQTKILSLPNRSLHKLWDSLILEDLIQFRLLRCIVRMISFSTRQSIQEMPILGNSILLHGPPGTGKTSLCRALAQQLSIRLSDIYSSSKLIEFDAHSIFSQYFGESGKAVNKLFAMIESVIDEDENTFVCLLVDDIESLAAKRQSLDISNEPQDSLRAVNALLTVIDRVRCRPNVLIFCTSNLIKAVDSAFLDRIDVKQHIPLPSTRERYEILRFCYVELARCGIIAPIRQPSAAATLEQSTQEMLLDGEEVELVSGSPLPEPCSTEAPRAQEVFRVLDDRDLPPYALMMLHCSPDEESLPRTLWEIATKSANLSARNLRRLPAVSLAMYTRQDPCPVDEALRALAQAVDGEISREQDDGAE